MFKDDYKKANKNISPSPKLISETRELMKQELSKNKSTKLKKNFLKPSSIGLIAAGFLFSIISFSVLSSFLANNGTNLGIKSRLGKDEFLSTVELNNGSLKFEENVPYTLNTNPLLGSTDNIKPYSVNDYIEYLGVDPRPSYIPKGLSESTIDPQDLFKSNNDSIFIDTFKFFYEGTINGNEASLSILTSKNGFLKESKLASLPKDYNSKIKDTIVKTAYNKKLNEYYADFTYKSINFSITASNLTQKDFINILLSIIS